MANRILVEIEPEVWADIVSPPVGQLTGPAMATEARARARRREHGREDVGRPTRCGVRT
jgi:hypothetical protein